MRLAALLCLALLPAAAVAAEPLPELRKTAPGHRDPAPMIPRPKPPPAEAHITEPEETLNLVINDKRWRDLGKPDPVLSNACKLGLFGFSRSLYRVHLYGKEDRAMLEAVPKHRHDLLLDPDKHARPGEAYYFRNAGWPDCEVHYEGPLPPRKPGKKPVDWEKKKRQRLEMWGKKEE